MDEQKIIELARIERNAYAKKWREKNKEKTRAYNEKYWRKKAAQICEAKKDGML